MHKYVNSPNSVKSSIDLKYCVHLNCIHKIHFFTKNLKQKYSSIKKISILILKITI